MNEKKELKNLTDWIEKYKSETLRTYERSKIPFDDLKKGTWLLMLRSGFSGLSGVPRIVVGHETHGVGRCAILAPSPNSDRRSLLYEKTSREGPWWLSAHVLTDKKAYLKLNTNKTREWQMKNLGKILDY